MSENYKEVYIENQLELNRFMFEPSQYVKDNYAEITKDLASSHLKKDQIDEIIKLIEILSIMKSNPAYYTNSIHYVQRLINSILQTNRSKDGFLTKITRSNFSGDITDTKNFEKEKNRTIFGGGNK